MLARNTKTFGDGKIATYTQKKNGQNLSLYKTKTNAPVLQCRNASSGVYVV